MPITPDVASPTIVLSAATIPGMHVTTMVPAQVALTVITVLDTPAITHATCTNSYKPCNYNRDRTSDDT